MPRKSATLSLAELAPASGGVAAVDRALSLLAAFRAGETALTLSDLALRTGLHKSTCLRLLASLLHAQLLQRTRDGHYALGLAVPQLHSIYRAGFALGSVVYPVLERLVQRTQECAAYSVIRQPDDGGAPLRLCLYRVNSAQTLRDHVREGDLLPLNRGAGGRVLLAFSSAAELKALGYSASRAEQAVWHTVRQQGYFAATGDRTPELAGIAAPVFEGLSRPAEGFVQAGKNTPQTPPNSPSNFPHKLAASLTLTMPTTRYQPEHIAHVQAAAKELSRVLGGASYRDESEQ